MNRRSPNKKSPKKVDKLHYNDEDLTDSELDTIISFLSSELRYYIDIQGKRNLKDRIKRNQYLPKNKQLL